MTERTRFTLDQLGKTLQHLRKMHRYVTESLDVARSLVDKKEATASDYREFEALTSRYARLFDILTRKTLRILFWLEFEEPETLIDLANAAEKRGLVESADEIFSLRILRNEVTHEYAEDRMQELTREVLEAAPGLLTIVDKTVAYADSVIDKLDR